MAPPMIPVYAGFWRRGAAFAIDGIVLSIPNFLVGPSLPDSTAAGFLAALCIGLPYHAGMQASPLQATLGKLALRIKVTDGAGRRMGAVLAIARYFATWLSALVLGIGFLIAAFTARRRALHDIACNTLVVNREAHPEDVAAGGGVMPVTWVVWLLVVLLLGVPVVAMIVTAGIAPRLH